MISRQRSVPVNDGDDDDACTDMQQRRLGAALLCPSVRDRCTDSDIPVVNARQSLKVMDANNRDERVNPVLTSDAYQQVKSTLSTAGRGAQQHASCILEMLDMDT